MSQPSALARVIREVIKDPKFVARFQPQQLTSILQSYENNGVGKKVSKQSWDPKQSYYTITTVKTSGNALKAWGTLTWNGVAEPKAKEISGKLKPHW